MDIGPALGLDILGTLLATIVGAAVALWGSHLLHNREQRARYEDGLDEAIAAVIEEASLYKRDAAAWRSRSLGRLISRPLNAPNAPPDPRPSLARFRALLDIASLKATADDGRVFSTAREVGASLADDASALSADRAYNLAQTLLLWRELDAPASDVRGELEQLESSWEREDEKRAAAERASDENDEE